MAIQKTAKVCFNGNLLVVGIHSKNVFKKVKWLFWWFCLFLICPFLFSVNIL